MSLDQKRTNFEILHAQEGLKDFLKPKCPLMLTKRKRKTQKVALVQKQLQQQQTYTVEHFTFCTNPELILALVV